MKKYTYFELIGVFIIFFTLIFPDVLNISPRHSITWGGMYVPQWDSNNAVVWAYMINKGLIPFRDFWYPYSFSYLFDYLQPWGAILQFSITAYLVISLYYLLRLVSGNFILIPFLAIIFLIVGFLPINNTIIFPQPERHLFPFVLSLYYFVCSNLFVNKKPAYLFWFSFCICVIFEPSQIIYAIPAFLIITIIEFKNCSALIKIIMEIFARFVPVILFIILFLIYLHKINVLSNAMDMYLHMDAITKYLAVPTDIGIRFNNIFKIKSFFLLMPFLLFGIGYFGFLRLDGRGNLIFIAILVVSSIGIMQLYKHSIRQTDWTIFYSAFLGVLLFSIFIYKKVSYSHFFIGGYVGILTSFFLINGPYVTTKERLHSVSKRVNSLLEVMNYYDANIDNYRNAMFSYDKTKAFEIENKIIDKIKLSDNTVPDFFSLTDNQISYIIAKKIPPYHINGLNGSPLFEQKKIINYLMTNKIDYILIDKSKLTFDGFSFIVRLPNLFYFIIQNYYIHEYVDDIAILKIKPPNSDKNINSYDSDWANLLGDKINYGYLIAYSKLSVDKLDSCVSDCTSYMVINTKDFNKNTVISIDINNYKIDFMAIPNKNVYVVNLNNIWFWNILKNPAVKLNQDVVSLRIIKSNNINSKLLY